MRYNNILVTGGAGFIGSHIVEELIKNDLNVIVYDNFSVGKIENLLQGIRKKIKIVKGDILNFKKLNHCTKNVDVVIHEAARVAIRDSVENFLGDARENIIGTLNVIKAIINNNVKKLIYASSMAVYSSKKGLVKENENVNPQSPYGISKLASEYYCLDISKNAGFDSVILRYFNTYGTKQTYTPYVGVITIFIKRLLEGKSPIIFGDGNQMRDFVYVKDVANATILAMEKNISGDVLNIGTGMGTSVNEIAKLLRDKINPKIKFRYTKEKKGELKHSIADISNARKLLDYKPKGHIEKKIDEVIEYNKIKL